MTALDSAQSAYVPHLSGIASFARFSPPTISLIIWTIIKSGSTILDRYVLLKGGKVFCNIDAIVVAALTTGITAHIPVIAFYQYRSLPTPSIPYPRKPTNAQNTICLVLIYAYSLLPCVPTLSKSITKGFDSSQGVTILWGFYCVDAGGWFRIVRPLTLLAPLLFTFPLIILIFSVLYSTSGHPSPHIRPGSRKWTQAGLLLLITVVVGTYLIIERIIGWNDSWWPRAFEGLVGPFLAISLLFDINIWKTYSFWIKLRLPPTPQPIPHTPLLSNSEWSLNTPQTEIKRSSSFYTPKFEEPTMVAKRNVRFPPTPQHLEFIPDKPIENKNRRKMESLLPPPAQRKGLSKPSINPLTHNTDFILNVEKNIHPHPHSIKDNLSPPVQLIDSTTINNIPEVVIQEPTPVYLSKYSMSSNQSPPFQYQDLGTVYSTARDENQVGHFGTPSESRNAARGDKYNSPHAVDTVYTIQSTTSEPFRKTYDTTLAYTIGTDEGPESDKLRESDSTGWSSKPGLAEMISTIGGNECLERLRETSARMDVPGPRPTGIKRASSEISSISSQPSFTESNYFNSSIRRPSLIHNSNGSAFSSNHSHLGRRTIGRSPEVEEIISFPTDARVYEYGEEVERSPKHDNRR
uniref:Uncharacterized protein n=1 Tax=Kwoniella pini CBS 10737 TaxID=1296096 RepID=A0A1B9HZI8_9TREE|nr:uncharacterized protein I206_05428 [Kwoniella pini CBS 10737]OCF48648.1 hypothetical protein I206_05428 [Kwoniella pini CBS 10737]